MLNVDKAYKEMKNTQTKRLGKGEIAIYKARGGETTLEVKLERNNIWLAQKEIAELFGIDRSVVTRHIGNIFKSEELIEKSNVQKLHIANSDRPVSFFSLDVIISVGYRVNSQRATEFRIWATKVLRNHLIRGYSLNRKRIQETGLKELEKTVRLVKTTLESKQLTADEAQGLLKLITEYTDSWLLFQRYDAGELDIRRPSIAHKLIAHGEAIGIISKLKLDLQKRREAGDLFGNERSGVLEGILANIDQSFDGKALYPSTESKAAHLLYFIIKDHPFIDGNKRIGCLLFLQFLAKNKHLLNRNGESKFSNNALVALALLVAESRPSQKDTIVKLIMNFVQK